MRPLNAGMLDYYRMLAENRRAGPDSGCSMVRILAPKGSGPCKPGPDATSKRAHPFGAIYSIAVSKSNSVYSVRLIGNSHN